MEVVSGICASAVAATKQGDGSALAFFPPLTQQSLMVTYPPELSMPPPILLGLLDRSSTWPGPGACRGTAYHYQESTEAKTR